MYELVVKTKFSAAHQLMGYEGRCENLHGHNWRVEVSITAERLNNIGLAIDFKDIKGAANQLLGQVEHTFLNKIPPFDTINPSSENISKWMFDELSAKLNDGNVRVSKVRVWESDDAAATYFE